MLILNSDFGILVLVFGFTQCLLIFSCYPVPWLTPNNENPAYVGNLQLTAHLLLVMTSVPIVGKSYTRFTIILRP